MAETPSGPIPGSRPVETTPVRIGQPRPGMPALQPDRLYPALVVRGGERPILRLLGHNVHGEPRQPGLQQGARLLVRPDIQGGRVTLHVMEHGDIQARVSQRFGRLVHRFPWPLPTAPQALAAQSAQSGAGGPGSAPHGGSAAGTPGQAAPAGRAVAGTAGRAPGPAQTLLAPDGAPARLTRPIPGGEPLWPRVPLQPPQAAGSAQARADPRLPGGGPAVGPAAPSATPGTGVTALRAALAVAGAAPGGSGGEAAMAGLASALAGAPPEAQARIGGSRQAVRHWLDALLRPAGGGGEPAGSGGAPEDRVLAEKGRLLLDRWAYIPLPLSGERSGAWVQLQERHGDEAPGDADRGPHALRIWLASERLGGMELQLPLGQGRTWRVRCERPETVRQLEAARPRLERLCRNAGQAMTLRVEGPHPDLGRPPDSLQRAATIEHAVSTRA
jgi:hypothetical protein